MAEDDELIFEGALYKLSGGHASGKKKTLKLSCTWKDKYFILKRQKDRAYLEYHDRKPRGLEDQPKGKIWLYPTYRVEKRESFRNRDFVFDLITPSRTLILSANDQRDLDLMVFFIQTQTKLNQSLEGECFVVKPSDSETQRRIGARGSICFLHISRWGISLALQLSHAVLSQWPLTCIRFYESTGRGQFSFDAGRRSPMGEGQYVFHTRRGQDNEIYDLLDRFIMETAGLARNAGGPQSEAFEEHINREYEQLLSLTSVGFDSNYSAQIKRISRDNYDHLWQNIGPDRISFGSRPDLVSNSPQFRQRGFSYSGSLDTDEPPPLPPKVKIPTSRSEPSSFNHQYINAEMAARHLAEGMCESGDRGSGDSGESEYLSMGSPALFLDGAPVFKYNELQPPPSFYEVMKAEKSKERKQRAASNEEEYMYAYAETGRCLIGANYRQENKSRAQKSCSANIPPGDLGEFELRSPGESDLEATPNTRRRRRRLRSKSCDDLSVYMRSSLYLDDNDTNGNTKARRKSERDEEENSMPQPFTGLYEYTDRRHSQDPIVKYSVKPKMGFPSTSDFEVSRTLADASSGSARDLKKLFSKRKKELRKAISNPNLLDDDKASMSSGRSSTESSPSLYRKNRPSPITYLTNSLRRRRKKNKKEGEDNLSMMSEDGGGVRGGELPPGGAVNIKGVHITQGKAKLYSRSKNTDSPQTSRRTSSSSYQGSTQHAPESEYAHDAAAAMDRRSSQRKSGKENRTASKSGTVSQKGKPPLSSTVSAGAAADNAKGYTPYLLQELQRQTGYVNDKAEGATGNYESDDEVLEDVTGSMEGLVKKEKYKERYVTKPPTKQKPVLRTVKGTSRLQRMNGASSSVDYQQGSSAAYNRDAAAFAARQMPIFFVPRESSMSSQGEKLIDSNANKAPEQVAPSRPAPRYLPFDVTTGQFLEDNLDHDLPRSPSYV